MIELSSLLSLIFRQAVRAGKVTVNPARLVPNLKESNGVIRYLEIAEESRLKAIVQPKHPERWAIITLALNTGCRAGELWGLKWTEVNRTTKQIALLATKNWSIRHVPLNDAALEALDVLLPFTKTTGFVLPRQHYRVWWEQALKVAKIDNYRFHDNRHTFASRCIMTGMDIRTLAELLGHRTLVMVLRYAHLAPEHLAEGVAKLSGFGTVQKLSTVESKSP